MIDLSLLSVWLINLSSQRDATMLEATNMHHYMPLKLSLPLSTSSVQWPLLKSWGKLRNSTLRLDLSTL